MAKCEICKKKVNVAKTLYKRKHKGKIYCFCSKKCKLAFMRRKGIVDML